MNNESNTLATPFIAAALVARELGKGVVADVGDEVHQQLRFAIDLANFAVNRGVEFASALPQAITLVIQEWDRTERYARAAAKVNQSYDLYASAALRQLAADHERLDDVCVEVDELDAVVRRFLGRILSDVDLDDLWADAELTVDRYRSILAKFSDVKVADGW